MRVNLASGRQGGDKVVDPLLLLTLGQGLVEESLVELQALPVCKAVEDVVIGTFNDCRTSSHIGDSHCEGNDHATKHDWKG